MPSFAFKVQISRLQPSAHEKETLVRLKDSATDAQPKRKRKRPGGPNPLSMLKSKKRKTGDETKVGIPSCLLLL